ncbi:MAG: type II toxin-antitoxin system Phd/YefM family antitoxin [Synergistaceae bacterium]|jgi:prevent-host-death family protein|nr:type II toxin-antitoxin system Phd/YefM family antitoxin [Synergistaceae bacterium]
MMTWQTQEAKAKFSELMKMAASAPQMVTLHGKPSVVVMSEEEYARLTMPRRTLFELMQDSPLSCEDLEFDRDRSLPRELNL